MRHFRDDYRFIVDLRSISTEELQGLLDEIDGGQAGPGIPPNEPVFVVRAKDVTAPATLRFWASRAEEVGAEARMVAMVRNGARQMIDWQGKHGQQVPDLPKETP